MPKNKLDDILIRHQLENLIYSQKILWTSYGQVPKEREESLDALSGQMGNF